jgi:hypothetical protein
MKNLLLVVLIFILLFFINLSENYQDDEYLKTKEQQQDEIANELSQYIKYTLNCPAQTDVVFSCNKNYGSVKSDSYSYCSDNVISKYICDMSNNSYTNTKFILSKFNMNDENERRKINNLMNNCKLNNVKCIDNTKECISRLLICILDKTYFARHRSLEEFKSIYSRAFKDCISSIEILSNKYALNCNRII